ncbi:arad-like aldolase/epimerase [Fomitiporia mediterranea MF3/22]|uniref:arad-like aldolase/epimerase n=1 Tax=Fomitiporia mediterranea (strain MF3/22) TaxID=694068 RepID=UPI0004407FD1|nr:arad-like aldolase/epimerase [Fomitiporia mediterranea MF3/22]EJD04714.1 arad-like aldolase/epimerase [Fomitiporia mediterranea MF3/22]
MAPVATSTVTEPAANGNNVNSKPKVQDEIHHDHSTMSQRSRTAFPRPPKFEDTLKERAYLKFRLAQAFRIFGKLGYDEGVAGHITVRDPIKTDCFWVNPFGLHFSLIQPEDLLLVDHVGSILDESGPSRLLNTAAFAIHYGTSGRPMCSTFALYLWTRILDAGQRAGYDHTGFFNGVVLAEEEGRRIAETLGNKKASNKIKFTKLENNAIILQNHGLLVATASIEATLHYFTALEKSCQVQLVADAAGKTVRIGDEEALDTYKTVGTSYIGWFAGRPAFQTLEANEGKQFEYK